MGKGIWPRINGPSTHDKVKKAEDMAAGKTKPKAQPKPKPKKKKSVESSVRDAFWGD